MRVAIFAIALAVRLIAIWLTGPQRVDFGDGRDYMHAASSLCAAHAYPDRGNLPFFRAPGLPFFIAGVTACHPAAVPAIKIALAVCDAMTCVLTAMLFGAICGSAKRAPRRGSAARDACATREMLAGLIAAFDPLFVAAVCDVRSEPLFMLLLTLAIVLLLRKREALSGIALALAALTRPSALIVIPLFALFRRRRAAPLLIAAVLTLAPWTMRNAVHFHRFIVVNDAVGYNLWLGANPELMRIESLPRGSDFDAASLRLIESTPQHADFTRLAFAEMRAHPAAVARFTAQKAWVFWRPWLNPERYDPARVVLAGVWNVALFVAGAIGIARSPLRRAVIVFFVIVWLTHLPFEVVMRFRIPFTDPLLIAFAACALRKERGDADSLDRSAAAAPA